MQHNRITVLSSAEPRHLGSSSSNPNMDPNNATVDEQILLPNTLESDSLPHYFLNSHEMGMPSGNLSGQQSTGLSLWEPAGSSSIGCLADHGNFFQSKRDHFACPLSMGGPISIGGGPLSIDRRTHEGTSSFPSHNLNIDLNINQSDQFGMEDVDVVHSSGQSRANTGLANRGSSTSEQIPQHEFSLDAIGSSSRTADPFDGVSGTEGGLIDSHRLTFKRKNIGGSHAESSANGSSHNSHQSNNGMLPAPAAQDITSLTMPTTANYAVSYPPVEQLNQNINVATSRSLSDHYSLYNDPHEHGFVRNTRMRISPNTYDQSLPSLLPEGSFRCSYQSTPQPSSFIPMQPREANAQSRPDLSAVTHFSQNLHCLSSNGNAGSRFGESSNSVDTTIHISSSNDPNRSLTRSDLPEPLVLASSLYNSDSTSLPSASGSRGDQQNSILSSSSTPRAALSVGAQQAHGTNSSQPNTTVRASADTARRSLISASIRSSSIALHQRGSSSASHEIRSHQPGSSYRAPQQHYFRGAPLSSDRQNSSYLDLQSFMQSIAVSRDGTRTVSELRNVVDQIRLGRNARLEDLLLIDRSLIMRRANLIDRHRDMRLDVDNMSYEELLALGERIGYVNTGLDEAKIMTSLKQRKYFCLELDKSPIVVEPCCICQEDYAAGEDMGRLDCGHDFHTACIKQWLVIKNLCPVCKKTALGS